MAGNKKDSNTSKTAHVMNLISRGRSTKPQSEEAAGTPSENTAQVKSPVVQPVTPPVSPIISIMNADAKASAVIKDALEESLIAELGSDLLEDDAQASAVTLPLAAETLAENASHVEHDAAPAAMESSAVQAAPAAVETPAVQAGPAAMGSPVVQAAPAAVEPPAVQAAPAAMETAEVENSIPSAEPPMPEIPAKPVEDTSPKQDVPSAVPAPSHEKSTEIKIAYVNVMQILVEENVDKYMKMFGLCSCPRCRADVAALALTNLIPQYIVTPENELSFRMVIYENRYSAEVTAQILRACKIVSDSPRHANI